MGAETLVFFSFVAARTVIVALVSELVNPRAGAMTPAYVRQASDSEHEERGGPMGAVTWQGKRSISVETVPDRRDGSRDSPAAPR
ncbi:hypothetical protein JNB63_12015 [Microbacterium trichothecenolyticum]|nr:hypothetical protein [Microbacterium trichothecenolyticum]